MFCGKSGVIRAVITNANTLKSLKRHRCTVEPVALSFASYESTGAPTDDDAPPLIVKHGLFGSKSNWNSLCKALQQKTNRKIIAVDARNHGDSPHSEEHSYEHLAADLRRLFDELKLEKASLLGHSMGGRAVMLFALKYPELVEKLIVADISPVTTSPNLRTMPALFTALKNIDLPRNVPMSSARTQADSQLSKFVTDRGLRTFLLTNLVQKPDGRYTWRINIRALLGNFESIAGFPDPELLKFDGPVLFLGGGASDFLRPSDHGRILEIFPKSQFTYIEGAGHWLHSEKPSEFLRLTVDFLNQKQK